MTETITFQDKDKRFNFTIKKEFLDIVSNPENLSVLELMQDKQMHKYLHNTSGPAIVRMDNKVQAFWINGMPIEDYVNDGDEPVKFNEYMKNAKEGI